MFGVEYFILWGCCPGHSRIFSSIQGFAGGTSGKESTYQCRKHKSHGLNPWVEKMPWSRKWRPTPVFLPGEFHGERSLVTVQGAIRSHMLLSNWALVDFSMLIAHPQQSQPKMFPDIFQYPLGERAENHSQLRITEPQKQILKAEIPKFILNLNLSSDPDLSSHHSPGPQQWLFTVTPSVYFLFYSQHDLLKISITL